MKTNRWNFALAVGLFLGALLACNATTAHIGSLKVATDEEGKNEAKSFKPGDKVYAVAQISNNPGKVQAKFRILYDDVRDNNQVKLLKVQRRHSISMVAARQSSGSPYQVEVSTMVVTKLK